MDNGFYKDNDNDVWYVGGGQAVLVWISYTNGSGRPPLGQKVSVLDDVLSEYTLTKVTPEAWIAETCPTCGK